MTALEKIGIEKFNEILNLYFQHNPNCVQYLGDLDIEDFYFKDKQFMVSIFGLDCTADKLTMIAFKSAKDTNDQDYLQTLIHLSGFLETLNVHCKKYKNK